MSDGITNLNLREPTAYQRDEINALKSRVRLLEVQEFPFVRHRDFDARGDLVVGTGDNTYDNLPVGANGTLPIADDTQPMGMRWGAATDISGLTEAVQDVVGLLFIDSTDLDLTYDDTLGTVSAVIKNDAVTNAKLANMAEATIKGRAAGASTGDPTDLTAAQVATILSSVLVVADITNFVEGVQDVVGAFFIDSADFDVTYDDALNTITGIIKNDAVTNAKAANMAQATVKGRASGAGTGDPTDLTASQVNTIVGSAALSLTSTLGVTGFSNLNGGFGIASNSPFWYMQELDGGTDAKLWDWFVDSEKLFLSSVNDAYSIRTNLLTFLRNGNMGVHVQNPQGVMHAHDGNGGKLIGSKAISSGTAVNIIPDATGDVTKLLILNYVIASSGGVTQGAHTLIANGGSTTIYSNAGNTVSMTVNANGSVEVQRTGGSLTYTVFYDMTWI